MQNFGGVSLGTTMLQQRGSVGGARSVFVKMKGKHELVFPPIGGCIQNPFKGQAKLFAGDLIEYRTESNGKSPKLYILKTFLVKGAVEDGATTIVLAGDGYKHIPFAGDILMVAPADVTATGTAVTVTAVKKVGETFEVTLSATLGAVKDGDILVEAEAAGADKKMLVTNPNTAAPADYDMFYTPATGDEDYDGARYFMTPVLHEVAFIDKMSPLPECIKKLNKSRVNGWFEI